MKRGASAAFRAVAASIVVIMVPPEHAHLQSRNHIDLGLNSGATEESTNSPALSFRLIQVYAAPADAPDARPSSRAMTVADLKDELP
jgi:hypothetical protein